MDIRDVMIYSEVEEIYTKLLVERTGDFLDEIFEKSEVCANYIKSIKFVNELPIGECYKDESMHFMSKEGFNRETKEIVIVAKNKLPLVYESIYHEIQHAKNNGMNSYNIFLNEKYPFVFNFLDEYMAYSKTLKFMLEKELTKNEKILYWYKNQAKKRNRGYEKNFYGNITYLKNIDFDADFRGNIIEIPGDGSFCIVNSLAYMLAKMNVVKIGNEDIKYSKLLQALNSVEGTINNMHCNKVNNVFEETLADLEIYF